MSNTELGVRAYVEPDPLVLELFMDAHGVQHDESPADDFVKSVAYKQAVAYETYKSVIDFIILDGRVKFVFREYGVLLSSLFQVDAEGGLHVSGISESAAEFGIPIGLMHAAHAFITMIL